MFNGRIRRLSITTAAIGSSGATTLAFNIAATRIVAPQQFGNLAREFSVAMLVAQITMASISPALARHVGQGDGERARWSRAQGALRPLLMCSFVCSLVYPILAMSGLAPVSAASLLAGSATAAVYPVYFGLKSFLFVLDKVELYAKLEAASDLLFYALLVASLTSVPDFAVACFPLAYIAFVLIAIRIISHRARGSTQVNVDERLLRYAGYSMLSTYASVARLPAVVAAAGLVGESVASGRVAAILALLTPLLLIPQAASVLTFAAYARTREPKKADDLRSILRLTFAITMAPIVVGIIIARPLLTTIYGAPFASLAPSFSILLLTLGPVVAGMPVGNALAGAGEVRTTAAIAIPGFFLTVVLACVGGIYYNAPGILIGCGVAMAASGVALAVIAVARLNLRLDDFMPGLALMCVGIVALVQPVVAVVAGVIVVLSLFLRRTRAREAVTP